VTLNFGPDIGSTIQFNGSVNTFQINNATSASWQWWITSGGSSANVLGDYGWFSGGPWHYGTIHTSGDVQYADITSPGTLTIDDGTGLGPVTGTHLTGNINWGRVSTTSNQGGVNAATILNISGLNYTGSDPDLLALASSLNGSVTLSFIFNGSMTLSQLSSGSGPYNMGYSGTITAVPEASTLVAGAGGLGLALLIIGRARPSGVVRIGK